LIALEADLVLIAVAFDASCAAAAGALERWNSRAQHEWRLGRRAADVSKPGIRSLRQKKEARRILCWPAAVPPT